MYMTRDLWEGAEKKCVDVSVAEKWLWRKDYNSYDRYRAQRAVMKQAVKIAQKWQIGNGESGWGMISSVIKRCFGKVVKRVKKGEHARDEMVKDVINITGLC